MNEYFYLEQWYRWLRDIFPLIVIGFVLVVMALCCCFSIGTNVSESNG
jgi:hypothetical protein